MPKDNERILEAKNAEDKDRDEKLAVVRSNLTELARIKKGLPPDPISRDLKALSALSNSLVVDATPDLEAPKATPVDVSSFPVTESVVWLTEVKERKAKKEVHVRHAA